MKRKLLLFALATFMMISLNAQPQAPKYDSPALGAKNEMTSASLSSQAGDSWSEDFEKGLGKFTVIKGGDLNSFEHSKTGGNKKPGCVTIKYHRTLAHNDYLVTPAMKVTRAGILSFWAKNRGSFPSTTEEFDVLLSTNGTAEKDFKIKLATKIKPPKNYTNYKYDLKPYIGKTVHIAIHIKTKNKFQLYLDDFEYIVPQPHDLAVTYLAPGFVKSGKKVNPEVTLYNNGTEDESTWSVRLTDGKAGGYDKTIKNTKTISSGKSITFDFPVWSPADGEHTLTATVTVAGDADITNNSKQQKINVVKLSYKREKIYAYNITDKSTPRTWKDHIVNVDKETGKLSSIKKTTLTGVHSGDYVGTFDTTMLVAVSAIEKKAYVVNGNGDTFFYRNIDIPYSVSGFTWDQSTNKIYAIAYDGRHAVLYTLDKRFKATPASGKIKRGVVYSIACDSKGNLFGLSETGRLYSIDKATGVGKEVGALGFRIWLAQDMGFDRISNTLYATLNKSYTFISQKGGLYTIDVKTGKATLIGKEFIDHLAFLGTYGNIPAPNDLSVKSISQKGLVVRGIADYPKVIVVNKGTKEQSKWSVKLSDGSGYEKTITNPGKIAPNASKVITFDDWKPKDGKYTLTATVTLENDKHPENNTKKLENIQVVTVSYEKNTIYAYNLRDWSNPKTWTNHIVKVDKKTAKLSSIKKTNLSKVFSGDMIVSKGKRIMLAVAGDNLKVYLINGNGDTYHYNTIKKTTSTILGFTWDPTTGKMYACSTLSLYSLDDDFNARYIGRIGGGRIVSIACDSKGNLYGLSYNDKLYKINKKTGKGTEIGNIGININFAQDMGFDRDTDILYGTLYEGGGTGGLYTIDTKTGKATQIQKDFKDNLAMLGTFSKSIESDITAFSFSEQVKTATINATEHKINISVKRGTDLTKLKATFTLSDGATAKVGSVAQVSGTTVNDFSKPVTYKVTAEDGKTSQDWVVTVEIEKSNKTDFNAFSFPEQAKPATIDKAKHTISISVKAGSDVTKLKATFTLSDGATAKVGSVAQVSGTTVNDFSKPVTYKVTAEDGKTSQDWVVTVEIEKSNKTDFTAFSFPEQAKPATIDKAKHTISISVKAGADVTKLKATFTLSEGATAKVGTVAQVSGTTVNDFSKPVTYKVTAEDGKTSQDWTVTVIVESTPTSIEDDLAKHGIAIYPNPSTGIFNVEVNEPFTIEVLDIKGRVIVESKEINGTINVKIPRSGIYFINFSNDNTSLTQRIIVSQ